MIYHSSEREVHQYFPKLVIPENEGIYKLNDGSDRLAFVILPLNGGKPVHVSNGYPQHKFDEEYVEILYRYYKYPAERDTEADDYKGFHTRADELEGKYHNEDLRFKILYTAIVLTLALVTGFFTLLAQPPMFFWIFYLAGVLLWIILIWKDRNGHQGDK